MHKHIVLSKTNVLELALAHNMFRAREAHI